MRFIKKSFLLIFIFLGVMPLQALEVHSLITPKGINVWFAPDKTVPVVSMTFSFENAGGGNDASGKDGRASLATSMLTEGAGSYTANTLSEKIAELGCVISFGADEDYGRGSFKTTLRRLKESVALFKTVLMNPTFQQDRLDLMRQQTLASIEEGLKQPGQILSELTAEKLYPHHPYGRPLKILLTTLPQITRADLQGYLKVNWGRSNLRVSICGNLTKDEVIALVDGVFGHLPKTVDVKPVADIAPPYTGETFIKIQDIPQSMCAMYHPGVSLKDPKYYTLRLIADIFGGGFQSRLMQEVREKRGLAYTVGAGVQARPRASSFYVGLGTENAKVLEAVALVKEELKTLIEKGVTDDELKNAKQAAIGAYILHLSNTHAIASLLQTYQENGYGPSIVNERASLINRITKVEMDAFLKSYFHPEKLTVFLVGNPVKENTPLEAPLKESVPIEKSHAQS